MYYPEFDRVVKLAEHYNVIPVSMEVHADMETPISLFKGLRKAGSVFFRKH